MKDTESKIIIAYVPNLISYVLAAYAGRTHILLVFNILGSAMRRAVRNR